MYIYIYIHTHTYIHTYIHRYLLYIYIGLVTEIEEEGIESKEKDFVPNPMFKR